MKSSWNLTSCRYLFSNVSIYMYILYIARDKYFYKFIDRLRASYMRRIGVKSSKIYMFQWKRKHATICCLVPNVSGLLKIVSQTIIAIHTHILIFNMTRFWTECDLNDWFIINGNVSISNECFLKQTLDSVQNNGYKAPF